MGYFSNGTEADLYEARHCLRCIHYGSIESGYCPVMNLHWLWNYEQSQDEVMRTGLEMFIPREGAKNLKCRMFHPKEGVID